VITRPVRCLASPLEYPNGDNHVNAVANHFSGQIHWRQRAHSLLQGNRVSPVAPAYAFLYGVPGQKHEKLCIRIVRKGSDTGALVISGYVSHKFSKWLRHT